MHKIQGDMRLKMSFSFVEKKNLKTMDPQQYTLPIIYCFEKYSGSRI